MQIDVRSRGMICLPGGHAML
ncbi:hypothetical protein GDI3740 [Gluconacetobacter diazotrophicus PA1 5]|uniref:Uncharacterized protein n=1 Tax=Gluconacetobacter diazotrophicus (strain ATCC 49037 / DSM 5601 / CCUG 37298 / CIP 103539 / LMG 7603 / PAl5) TaxID=272568 RepID=A9H7T8_GLUDA|nr:hypothetical protein GDI3740 [Gluconacetobacter diazotrophicus PA1 5]